jgi:N-methylhydantoinase B
MFANQSCPSAEIIEAEQPVSVLAYEFVPDKAGAGKYRGGVPFQRQYRLNETEAMMSVRSDRKTHRPFGLYGGSPGRPSENYFNPQSENRPLPSKVTMQLKRGDVFCHIHPGGGGWGDPLERDPAAVLRDVRNEFISAARAEAAYGVVIDTNAWSVDAAATKRRRADMRQRRGWREVPKVQWYDPEPLCRAAE